MKKAIITGGSGFFGECLINYLTDKQIDCYSIDINEPEKKDKLVKFYKIDVCNTSELINSFKYKDIVFHSVATVPLAKDKKLFYKTNVLGTKSVLDASVEAKIKKVVILSSSAVYGIPTHNPVDENTIPNPMEDYGRAKLESEKICFDKKYSSIDISIIRPRTILGHGRLGIFEILFQWVSDGYNIPVLNGGNNLYQFVHADDLASACHLSTNLKGVNILNCGTDKFSTMKDVLQYLCDYSKSGSKVKSLPMWLIEPLMSFLSLVNLSPLAPYHSLMYGRSLYFDIKKLSELGWQPKYSNNEMFKESFEWYLNNKSNIDNSPNKSTHKTKVKQKILSLLKYII